jgi:hypothetical protein
MGAVKPKPKNYLYVMIIHVGIDHVQFFCVVFVNYAGESATHIQSPVTNMTAVRRYKMEISFCGFLLSEV